jgi:regulatory protein
MKKITLVERQKKNPQRFNIYLDGDFAFGADEDTVVNFRLLKGKAISEEEFEKIIFETEIGKLMERMYGLFGRRQRTEKEVRDYLRNLSFKRTLKDQEAISPFVVDKVIARLYEKRLLDDRLFAEEWVRARQLSKKKGQIAIKQELMQKGVAKEVIDEVMEVQTSPENEYSLAQEALVKKERLFKGLEGNELKQKTLQFLLRRGFSYETAKDVVEEFVKKVYTVS